MLTCINSFPIPIFSTARVMKWAAISEPSSISYSPGARILRLLSRSVIHNRLPFSKLDHFFSKAHHFSSENEVRRYYQDCLDEVGDPVHARLSVEGHEYSPPK